MHACSGHPRTLVGVVRSNKYDGGAPMQLCCFNFVFVLAHNVVSTAQRRTGAAVQDNALPPGSRYLSCTLDLALKGKLLTKVGGAKDSLFLWSVPGHDRPLDAHIRHPWFSSWWLSSAVALRN